MEDNYGCFSSTDTTTKQDDEGNKVFVLDVDYVSKYERMRQAVAQHKSDTSETR
ncbi:hypothetical protein [Vibrio sp. ER1A]|uniref:hypothetical protein n=1 Tax=Vibrio sp. ER1A TaxID=1517681 RepID=UPI000B0E08E7|nr:hypothetical protein [Vibrio sp. ER1A]